VLGALRSYLRLWIAELWRLAVLVPRSKRASKQTRSIFDRTKVISVGPLFLMVVGQIVLVVTQIVRGGNPARDSIGDVLSGLTWSLGLCLAFTVGLYLWRLPTIARGARLRQLHATVVSAWRTPEFVAAGKQVIFDRTGSDDGIPVAMNLTLGADTAHVAIWQGWPRQAREVFAASWAEVSRIELGSVLDRNRPLAALTVWIRSRSGDIALPFVVNGRGIAGLFPQTVPALESLVVELETLRQAALHSGEGYLR
jgi:hypothetical protein